ncbi:hypothetical protein SEUCBS140593_010045 [Sporothrix eucalyptigena]|uniref:Protection of telomeres protein 1 ssDNA-binding domain-containing protein n=1 Tax=Sporothrix eucalyptigena TaxID=1812306 RepID=A0ABP0CZQ0_9PEZI
MATDYKMAVFLTDISLETSGNLGNTVCFNIFLPNEDNMPEFKLADVVLIKSVLVQGPKFDLGWSLLLRPKTRVYTYRAQLSSPSTLNYVPWTARPKQVWQKETQIVPPSPVEIGYALYIHKKINKDALPDITTFEQTAAKSMQTTDKRRELKDVCVGNYCDLLVQVVSDPHIIASASHSYAMLWVSDYSENNAFEHKGLPIGGTDRYDVGDANGYLTKHGARINAARDNNGSPIQWLGPQGRQSMFMVCFNPHAHFIQENVKRGSWVTMKNVQIKLGNHGIEGVMGDDTLQGSPLRVALVDLKETDRENIDPRFLAALRRKKDYEKGLKAEAKKRKELHDGSNTEDGKPLNAKQRRKLERKLRQAGHTTAATVPLANRVNNAISSEFGERTITALARILEPNLYTSTGEGTDTAKIPLHLPFANIKFKAQVRIVDYLPHRLSDFAVPCRTNEFDILGDDSDSSGSSSSSENEAVNGDDVSWQWRFALLLEDASSPTPAAYGEDDINKAPPVRLWAVVDDFHGQTLLKMDATDLRKDNKALGVLREKMFLLWGNLEEFKLNAERKARAEKEAERKAQAEKAAERKRAQKKEEAKQAAKDKEVQERERIATSKMSIAQYPPPTNEDSDDDGTPTPKLSAQKQQKQQEQEQKVTGGAPKESANSSTTLKNIPFICCLHQYGVLEKVNSDDADSDASDEECTPKKVWRPTFGMFGTTIRSI